MLPAPATAALAAGSRLSAVIVWTPSPSAARPMAASQPPGAAAAQGYALEESFLSLCIASERVGGWLDAIRGPSSRPRCGSKAQCTCLLPCFCERRLRDTVQYFQRSVPRRQLKALVKLADAVNDNEAYAEEVRHCACSPVWCLRAATRGANYPERPRPWPSRLTVPAQQHAWFISFAPPASQGPGVKSHCDSCIWCCLAVSVGYSYPCQGLCGHTAAAVAGAPGRSGGRAYCLPPHCRCLLPWLGLWSPCHKSSTSNIAVHMWRNHQ